MYPTKTNKILVLQENAALIEGNLYILCEE